LDIDISQVQNNKISILEQFDEHGLCKETLIYHNCFDDFIADLKKEMELIECFTPFYISNAEICYYKSIIKNYNVLI